MTLSWISLVLSALFWLAAQRTRILAWRRLHEARRISEAARIEARQAKECWQHAGVQLAEASQQRERARAILEESLRD